MKQVLNKSEAKLVRRVLRMVEGRMEGRDKSGDFEDEDPAYHKETVVPHRHVVIDMTPAELASLRRLIAWSPDAPMPLTPREEGLLAEMKRFLGFLDGIHQIEELDGWSDRFNEIIAKMEGAK